VGTVRKTRRSARIAAGGRPELSISFEIMPCCSGRKSLTRRISFINRIMRINLGIRISRGSLLTALFVCCSSSFASCTSWLGKALTKSMKNQPTK